MRRALLALALLLCVAPAARAEVLIDAGKVKLERLGKKGATDKKATRIVVPPKDVTAMTWAPAGVAHRGDKGALVLTFTSSGTRKVANVSSKPGEYPILDGKGSVKIFFEELEAAASILTIAAGAAVPEHVHRDEAEILFIRAGGGEMTIAGKTVTVVAGKAYHVPAGTKHAFTATSDVEAVQFYVPGGPEQRFKTANVTK